MANKETKRLGNKGFSLVELIVVIAIMAVLVGVLAPQFIRYVEKSRESTDLQNLDSVKTVVENYYADKEGDKLPTSVEIKLASTLTITETGNTTANDIDKMMSDNGIKNIVLKGSKWDPAEITATWNLQENKWVYAGSSPYYAPSENADALEAQ